MSNDFFCLSVGNQYMNILKANTSIYFKQLGKNERLHGNKKRIMILLVFVASTKHIAEQIGWAGPEGKLVLGQKRTKLEHF